MTCQGYSSYKYREVYFKNPTVNGVVDDLLVRNIKDTNYFDVITTYPFTPNERIQPHRHLGDTCISGIFISDPLCKYIPHESAEKYKEHYIVDLQQYDFNNLPENHRRNINKNEKNKGSDYPFVVTEVCTQPAKWHNRVSDMYQNLVERHDIKEDAWTNYSRDQIKMLLEVPGSVLFKTLLYQSVFHLPDVVNFSLFYIGGSDVYYHLSSMSEKGYKTNANFVMMHEAIMFFKSLGLNRLLIGSVPDGGSDGLLRFKKGFSTGSEWNYIIKHIYNQEVHDKLSEGKDTTRFPAYR